MIPDCGPMRQSGAMRQSVESFASFIRAATGSGLRGPGFGS